MNKGIKAIFCMTLAFALMAGMATGCKNNGSNSTVPDNSSVSDSDYSSENTIFVPVASETTAPSDSSNQSDDLGGAVPEKGTVGDYEYRILGKDEYRAKQAERGYYIDRLEQEDSPYYIVICSGEKNTGGYDIGIAGIDYQDGALLITVKETSPAPGDMVTQAIEYPCCVLELDKLPDAIHIVNTEGVDFNDVSDTDNGDI